MDCTPLTRYLPGGVPASWYTAAGLSGEAGSDTPTAQGQPMSAGVPLETVVERERVRDELVFKPRLAAEAGLHFLRVLAHKGLGAQRAAVGRAFPLDASWAAGDLDAETQRFLSVMAGRVPDGTLIAVVQRVLANAAALNAFEDPFKMRVAAAVNAWRAWSGSLTAADQTALTSAAGTWLTWYDSLFSQPTAATASSWIPKRLEYEFAASAPMPRQEVILTAPEYIEGHLDWYSFDLLPAGSLGAVRTDLSSAQVQAEPVRRIVIPTPVRYPGMPGSRYWEFEDARVDFGAIAAGAQQLAHLLLIDFALVSGDDWFVIPVDMAVGSVSTVRWLVVTDSFGDRTLIPSARQVDRAGSPAEPAWDMFHLARDVRPVPGPQRSIEDLFLLPPSLGVSLHGAPAEEVVLLRDEMANMAWAVERVVESPLGRPFDRAEAFHRSRRQADGASTVATVSDAPQGFVYRLATGPPAHWLPLYPWRSRADAPPIRLLRGGLPQGRILEPSREPSVSPLLISEEEVPRAGARITRAFQYARWTDGSTHLWVGRRKTPGRGEGSSGLRFDMLEPRRR
jgi:hypothetical protein